EGTPALPQVAELPGEVLEGVEVEVGVQAEVVLDGLDEVGDVQERAGGKRLGDQGPHELLLAGDPGEVRDDVALDVPGPDEGQGLRATEVVATRVREVQSGQRVHQGLVDA